MGVFNQFHHFVDGYGKKNTPVSIMSELSRTKVPFIWTDRHTKTLETLRVKLLGDELYLYVPHNDLTLHL